MVKPTEGLSLRQPRNGLADETVRSRLACIYQLQGVMKTLMQNGRDRRSENPLRVTRRKSARVCLGPIQRITSGPAARRPRSKAGYMTAPLSFRERSDSFPLHRGRRPYMTQSGPKPD